MLRAAGKSDTKVKNPTKGLQLDQDIILHVEKYTLWVFTESCTRRLIPLIWLYSMLNASIDCQQGEGASLALYEGDLPHLIPKESVWNIIHY